MEVVAKTEYQDVYRITDGVLLVVNKFNLKYAGYSVWRFGKRGKKYNPNTKDLYVLQEDYTDVYGRFPETVPKGTVLYFDRPVVSTDDKSEWKYFIKTTGECFSGYDFEIKEMLKEIEEIICSD